MQQARAAGRRVPTPTATLKAGPPGRHLVDVTLFFTPTSGGVRRYLLARHDWLARHTHLKHTVLVPGPRDSGLPYDFMQFASPAIPFGRGYRLPLRMQEFRQQLARPRASCDAFVHAGAQETFGLVVLEAMACGLPVVAARAGALPELVDASVGATFEPRDPDDLARKVATLFEGDREATGRVARKRAESYSWDSVFTRMLGRYVRFLAQPTAAPMRLPHGR